MLRNSSPPIVPRRGDAPITATERGSKNGLSDAATATWSRSSRRSTTHDASCRDATTTSITPPCSVRAVSNPASSRTRSIARVPRKHLGHELLDAGRRGVRGEPLEQARADAATVKLVGDGERDLGAAGSRRRTYVASATGRGTPCRRRDRRRANRDSTNRYRAHAGHRLVARCRRAVEPHVATFGRQRFEERDQRTFVVGGGRSKPHGRSVAKDDVLRQPRERRRHGAIVPRIGVQRIGARPILGCGELRSGCRAYPDCPRPLHSDIVANTEGGRR